MKGFTRVTQLTRTLIDLFITSRPELYFAGIIPVGFSDHSTIFGAPPPPSPKIFVTRNYKHYNPALFRLDLEHILWEIIKLEETPKGSWNTFKDLILTIADMHAPIVRRQARGYSQMNNDDLLTLYKIVPKKIKLVPSRSDGPTASSFNCLFTSIANTLCSHFKRCSLPKVKHDVVLEEVSFSFVQKELLKMKPTKALFLMECLLGY
ncbi:unnamed protein product [Pocillopora meandrina]|uniref:Uncharacterized protein n=1 Tax=Pocillopora meandrina TaxID=46732 RepID=A0AAU9XRW0_9CNID|nr:unnamed protein product [Pocillopora meandrina]